MSRAALLPSMGDPLLLPAWLSMFPRWQHVVDKLYISVSPFFQRHYPLDAWEQLARLCASSPKIQFVVAPTPLQHGDNIRSLLGMCNEDIIVLVEDDLLIRDGTKIDECFRDIESGKYDVVGSPRGCTSQEIINAEVSRFNIVDTDLPIRACPNFWPSLLFARPALLHATDEDFNAKTWAAGEYIPQLGLSVAQLTYGDTFVWASIQIRALTSKIGYVDQGHARIEPKNNEVLATAPWIHYGSLSGIPGFIEIQEIRSQVLPTTIGELSRRSAFCKLLSLRPPAFTSATAYAATLGAAVDRFVAELPAEMVRANIEMLKRVLPEIFTC